MALAGRRSGGGAMLMVVVVMAAAAGMAGADFAADRAECADKLMGLATCLPYVQLTATAPAPTRDCCSGFRQVLGASKRCMCVLVKDRDEPALGIKVNITRAMNLASACSIAATFSDCPKILNMAPDSKAAEIFKQYGIEHEGKNATVASPTAAAAATGSQPWQQPPQPFPINHPARLHQPRCHTAVRTPHTHSRSIHRPFHHSDRPADQSVVAPPPPHFLLRVCTSIFSYIYPKNPSTPLKPHDRYRRRQQKKKSPTQCGRGRSASKLAGTHGLRGSPWWCGGGGGVDGGGAGRARGRGLRGGPGGVHGQADGAGDVPDVRAADGGGARAHAGLLLRVPAGAGRQQEVPLRAGQGPRRAGPRRQVQRHPRDEPPLGLQHPGHLLRLPQDSQHVAGLQGGRDLQAVRDRARGQERHHHFARHRQRYTLRREERRRQVRCREAASPPRGGLRRRRLGGGCLCSRSSVMIACSGCTAAGREARTIGGVRMEVLG